MRWTENPENEVRVLAHPLKKDTEDGEEHYNGLRCLATPAGAAMFADILHSSETHSLILANVYGLVCSTKEHSVSTLAFLHG